MSIRTVSKDMKALNLVSCYVKKFKPAKSTCSSDENCINHLKNQNIDKPHSFVATDITYIHTKKHGFVYLISFLDLFSRKILHFDIGLNMDSNFVNNALNKFITKFPAVYLIHSDRGSQFTANSYREFLSNNKITASYSAKGYPYDNAIIESYHAALKIENLYRVNVIDLKHGKSLVFQYNYGFYNNKRIHKSLGYISPNQFENLFFQSLCKDIFLGTVS